MSAADRCCPQMNFSASLVPTLETGQAAVFIYAVAVGQKDSGTTERMRGPTMRHPKVEKAVFTDVGNVWNGGTLTPVAKVRGLSLMRKSLPRRKSGVVLCCRRIFRLLTQLVLTKTTNADDISDFVRGGFGRA